MELQCHDASLEETVAAALRAEIVSGQPPVVSDFPLPGPRSLEDPVALYHAKYEGLTRGELKNRDQSLYNKLRALRKINVAPLQPRTLLRRSLSNPVALYHEKSAGLTQSELRKKDPSLYQTLWYRRLLYLVPRSR